MLSVLVQLRVLNDFRHEVLVPMNTPTMSCAESFVHRQQGTEMVDEGLSQFWLSPNGHKARFIEDILPKSR
jgi:hypothetical protein